MQAVTFKFLVLQSFSELKNKCTISWIDVQNMKLVMNSRDCSVRHLEVQTDQMLYYSWKKTITRVFHSYSSQNKLNTSTYSLYFDSLEFSPENPRIRNLKNTKRKEDFCICIKYLCLLEHAAHLLKMLSVLHSEDE